MRINDWERFPLVRKAISELCKPEVAQFELDENGEIAKWFRDDLKQPTKEEIDAKIKELEVEEIKKAIEKRADEFVQKQLKELDYNDMGEVALYAANSESEWHDEAVALQKWVEEVYQKMYELEESVTIDNYNKIDLNKIEAEYPVFEKGAE